MVRGPLLVVPLIAFAAGSSRLTLFGLGPLFWGLVIGTGISLVLEGTALQATAAAGTGEK